MPRHEATPGVEHLFESVTGSVRSVSTSDDPPHRDALARLARTLGADPQELGSVTGLDAPALERLESLVADALEQDEARVTEAVEETVRFVPRPLRGRAKKMLFPEGP